MKPRTSLILSLTLLLSTVQAAPWTGTITVRASQVVTPNSTLPNAPKVKTLQEVADEYEKKHPGIKIKFVDESIDNYLQIYRARAAAGELWDIFWANAPTLFEDLPEGIALDLRPYLNEKSPYSNSKTWRESLNKQMLTQFTSPTGAIYSVGGDALVASFYYNPALFKKAGITREPASWAELVSTAKKLKAAGITPCSGAPTLNWFMGLFLSNFYSKDLGKIGLSDGKPGISPTDQAVAVKRGILSPKDPRFMSWWPVFKQLSDQCAPDYFNAVPYTQADGGLNDFAGGKVGMVFAGSYLSGGLRQYGIPFGTFSFPAITRTMSPYATSVRHTIGGPGDGYYQWNVASPRANRSMQDRDKVSAVIDFLRFLMTSKNVQKVVNEAGSTLPIHPGTKPAAGNEALLQEGKYPTTPFSGFNLTSAINPELQSIFGLYLSGGVSFDGASQQVQAALDKAVTVFERDNGKIDLSKSQ